MSFTRYCDGMRQPCPHPHNCTVDCEFNTATLPTPEEYRVLVSERKLVWASWALVALIACSMIVGASFLIVGLL